MRRKRWLCVMPVLEEADKRLNVTVDVVVEIPKGRRNKYECGAERKAVRFDRMLFSAVHCPSD